MGDYNRFELIKLNIKQFFYEMNLRKKKRKKYKIDKLIQRIPVENTGYEDLAPESNIKNGEEYLKALYWAVKNKKVKNIALTGPYGSGKSSIIQSYLNKYPSTKALKISLATFDFEKNENHDLENEIELGILKQLFYKVSPDKIPQSRYRKIKKKCYWKYFFITAYVMIVIMLGITFFIPNIMENATSKVIELGKYHGVGKVMSYAVSGFFGVLGIAFFSWIIELCSSKFRLKEVNIADKATIVDEKDEKSIFDKSMDEIVYFFEETGYNVVFIEDLDRFNSTKIFVKLRELNTILNNYDLIKRRIVFVYAIKDDMFKDEERTKFFDFIVPVIPIINSTNSGEILREKLKVEKQLDGSVKSSLFDISASYITLVSPFIEDMRILTSICNEFFIYKNTLNSVRLNDEEMFSIIIFKNLYPKDFSELESEKGIVKQAFDNKKQFIINKQTELEKTKHEKEMVLNEIERDILNDVKEVKAAFLDYLVGENGPFVYCKINSTKYSYSKIMEEDFNITVFKNSSTIEVYNENEDSYYTNPARKIIQDDVDAYERISNYCFRIECLNSSEASRKEEMIKSIEVYDKIISELHTYTLKEMIEKYGNQNIFSENVNKNNLLVFLLRKGFINENYADYINYFHPNSITKDEMNYIRGIRMQESVGDFSYSIRNVEEVCNRIEDYEFKQTETLNFDITDYLLTKNISDNKCIELFNGLGNDDKIHQEFIKDYIQRNKNIDIFINMLCQYNKMFWTRISNNNLITDERKFYYLRLIIEYANLDNIKEMDKIKFKDENDNKIEGIAEFIKNDKQALVKLSEVSPDKMIDVIKELKIKFEEIEVVGAERAVIEYIFKNNSYILNMSMLQSLFEVFYPDKAEELTTSNYTVISEVGYEPLLERIYNDFENYVSKFVIGQETNINESIHSVEDIIERLIGVNLDLCLSTLGKSNILWEDINDCCKVSEEKKEECKKIWNYLLKNGKVKETWNNYLVYYKNYNLTSELIEWVNSKIGLIIQNGRINEFTDELLKELIIKGISINAFTKIVKEYRVDDFDCSLSEFSEECVSILNQHDWIPFTLNYLEEMKQYYPNLVLEYIYCNKDEFIKNLQNVSLDVDTISDLFDGNMFDINEKLQLLELFYPKDMTPKMAFAIRNLEIAINKEYVDSAWDLLDESDRYQLLLNQLEVYTVEEISEKFKLLAPVYQSLSDISRRHKEYIDINEYNRKLINKLKEKKYITSFEEESYINKDKNQEIKRFGVWVKQNQ